MQIQWLNLYAKRLPAFHRSAPCHQILVVALHRIGGQNHGNPVFIELGPPRPSYHLDYVLWAVLLVALSSVLECRLDDHQVGREVYAGSQCACRAKHPQLALLKAALHCPFVIRGKAGMVEAHSVFLKV